MEFKREAVVSEAFSTQRVFRGATAELAVSKEVRDAMRNV